jgi:hypothetical protein
LNGENLPVEFKIYEHRYTFQGQFAYAANMIRHSLEMMGHTEGDNPDLHIYNHTCRDLEPDMPENSLIFKPTAPTSQHFQIDRNGYANSSDMAFIDPTVISDWRNYDNSEINEIKSLILRRANKWDQSILINGWDEVDDITDDHILVIGQMPGDETVDGFGWPGHIQRIDRILDKLEGENVVLKLHPKYKPKTLDEKKLMKKWKEMDIQILRGFTAIHSVLPKTRVAILDNSTAGIECMMHEVPMITYGHPDYHWVTKDMRSPVQLRGFINDLSWYDKELTRKFLCYYIFEYLCSDIDTTMNRLQELL